MTPARRTARAFKSTLVYCTRGFEDGSRKKGRKRFEAIGRQKSEHESEEERPQSRQARAPDDCARRVFRAAGVFRSGCGGVAGTHVSRWLRRFLSIDGADGQGSQAIQAYSDRLR